jgi:heat shock protein HslJ
MEIKPLRGKHMFRNIFISVLGMLLLSACSAATEVVMEGGLVENEIPENDLVEIDLPGNELIGTEWVLVSLNGRPLLGGTNITLAFYPGEISGFAGCNGYGGPIEFLENNGIHVVEIASQAEGCIEPEGVLEQESEYFNILWHIEHYELDGDVLTFSNPNNGQTLVYSNRAPFESDPASLENTNWNLLPSDSFPLINGSAINISFSKGHIEGYAGCRDYEGEYAAEGDKIVFPFMMMLGELCDDLDLQIQEGKFTTWLGLSTHFQIQDEQLELNLATGDKLAFEGLD